LRKIDKICAIPAIKKVGDVGDSFIVPMRNIVLNPFSIDANFKLCPGLSPESINFLAMGYCDELTTNTITAILTAFDHLYNNLVDLLHKCKGKKYDEEDKQEMRSLAIHIQDKIHNVTSLEKKITRSSF